MNKNLKSNIAFWFLISTIVYLILIFFLKKTEFEYSYILTKLDTIILIILLVIFIYFLKYLRWIYILKKNNIDTKLNNQKDIFIKSLLYSFTPGKVGEFIKAYYLKEKYSIELDKGIYFTLLEKAAEIISLFILFTILYLSIFYTIIIMFTATVFFYLIFKYDNILQKNNKNKTLNMITNNLIKVKYNFKYEHISIYITLIIFSIFLWLLEGEIFSYLVTNNTLNINIGFNYLISMFLGTISFLPAGIGLSDFSLNYLLIKDGIDEKITILSVIIFRFITVWMPVIFSALYSLITNLLKYLNKKR